VNLLACCDVNEEAGYPALFSPVGRHCFQEYAVFVSIRVCSRIPGAGRSAAMPLAAEQGCQLPWFILVPRRADISELFELDEADQQQLWQETNALAGVEGCLCADKMNVATLVTLSASCTCM
jgi:hypothetical protein